jgi:cation diffusion facilitator CzcD-associated flavoprotein CzcO
LAGGGEITCSFLYACTGYYRYDEGFSPQIEGAAEFAGRIVHPQHWPADLDHTGRRVAVIGSGATAMTLVPAMAADAEHVTMVQRSPTYVIALPNADPIAAALRRILPTRAAHAAARWKNALRTVGFYAVSRRAPRLVARLLRRAARRRLPPGYDVQTHFTPRYAPWDQRMCLVPDGDLFTAVSEGRASIVTDHIERYTQRGLLLASGAQVEADIVVTATGLNLLALGGMTLSVDGAEVDLAQTVTYKGMMLSGVPNLALIVGYTNSSWTLKADLVAEYVCRVLRHMEEHGQRICTPVAPAAGPRRPLIDLAAGYVERSAAHLPKQGSRTPWRLHQNYPRDVLMLRRGRVDDEGVRFSA